MQKYSIKLIKIGSDEKKWINPCIPYNIGFKHATGDIIIIQNPECCHVGDILAYVENNLTRNEYYTFSCFSSKSYEMNEQFKNILLNDNNYQKTLSNIINQYNGKSEYTWYNHPQYNPSGLHFLSAIYKEQLDKINGFDERYKQGYCFDDNDFVNKIKYTLGLDIKIIPYLANDIALLSHQYNVYCVHLFHDKHYVEQNSFTKKFNINLQQFYRNHDEQILQLIGKYSQNNITNYQVLTLSNKKNMEIKRKKTQEQNNNDIMAKIKIHNVPYIFSYGINVITELVSRADLGKYDRTTNITNILNSYPFNIKFDVKCDISSKLYLFNGKKESEYLINKNVCKINIITELIIGKWYFTIKDKNIKKIYISNIDIRLYKTPAIK